MRLGYMKFDGSMATNYATLKNGGVRIHYSYLNSNSS